MGVALAESKFAVRGDVAGFVGKLLAVLALMFLPASLPGVARADVVWADAPTGVAGLCYSGGPHAGCYSDSDTACKAEMADNGGTTYDGSYPTELSFQEQCEWHGGTTILPSVTVFHCASGYSIYGPERCSVENFKSGKCPTTAHPINILSGAKIFRDNDFTNTDGTFSFDRTFVSRPYGGLKSTAYYMNLPSLANWTSFFDISLHIGYDWSDGSQRIVTVEYPDGTAQMFQRQSDGSMAPYASSDQPIPDKDATVAFVGVWPTDLNSVRTASSQWTVRDKEGSLWTLQTWNAPNIGYSVARPISVQRRDGTTLTFTYDSNNALTTITDQNAKAVTLTWNMQSFTVRDSSGTPITTYNVPGNLAQVTLPGGYKVKYSYQDSTGAASLLFARRLVKVEYLDAAGVVQDSRSYDYGNVHFPTYITGIRDKDGTLRWQVTYDDVGRATVSQGPNGELSDTISYSGSGTTFSRTQTDALGRQTVYNFSRGSGDFAAKLTGINGLITTHCPASSTANTFDSNAYLATATDEEGRVTQYTNDTVGRPTSVTEAYGTAAARTTGITWNANFYDLPDQVTAPGLTTNYTYDSYGRVLTKTLTDTTTITVPYATNGRTHIWAYTYGTTGGALGKLVSIDGPMAGTGDLKSYSYTASGYLQTMTDDIGKVYTITAWDWRGAPATVVDPNGVSTTLTYDIRGRVLTTTIDPGANQSQYTFTYNAMGDVTKIRLPQGGFLSYTYDAARRLTAVGNEKGESIALVPDMAGNATRFIVKDAAKVSTLRQSIVFDELGRMIQILGAASTTPTNMAYDKVDNLASFTDGRGKTSTLGVDALDRVITATNPDSQSTQYAYAANDALTSHKDGRGIETTRVVDGFGQTIMETSQDRGINKYWYNNAGQLTKKIDGDVVESDYAYYGDGRLHTVTFPASAGETMTYNYDDVTGGNKGVGRLTSVSEASGTSALTYNNSGRIIKDIKVIQGKTYTLNYTYDSNRALASQTLPSGRVVTFTRNSEGRMTAITTQPTATGTASNVATAIAYQPFGPLASLTYGNGLALTRTYNLNGWLTRIEVKATGVTTLDLGYTYYDDGRLGEIDDNAATGRTVYITLSNSGRLTYAGGPWGNETFTYDAAGNRSGDFLTVGGTTTTTNAIINTARNRVIKTTNASGAIQRTLTYGFGGSLTTDAQTAGSTYDYTYNTRQRLVAVKKDGTTVSNYAYDFRNQRVARTLITGGASTYIHYVYDETGHMVGEYDGATGNVLREYIWLDDMPLAVVDSTSGTATTYYIHGGHLGEPQVMTDASKAKVWDAYVNPFGKATTFSSPTVNSDIRLPGQWYQAEAAVQGLNQNRFRDYDPTLGRYIEVDPMGIEGGQNPYAYVDGRPYDATDPYGLWKFTVQAGDGAASRTTIGYNCGQWSFGEYIGVGEGLSASLDLTETDATETSVDFGIAGNTTIPGVKIPYVKDLDFDYDFGSNDLSVSGPGVGPVGVSLSKNGLAPTLSAGESVFVGVGGTVNF